MDRREETDLSDYTEKLAGVSLFPLQNGGNPISEAISVKQELQLAQPDDLNGIKLENNGHAENLNLNNNIAAITDGGDWSNGDVIKEVSKIIYC